MLSLIAAISKNHVIGNKGKVPWHITEDYIYFNKVTKGHPVIMGRKTHESISVFEKHKGWNSDNPEIKEHRLLPNRTNIIVTRQEGYSVPDAYVVKSIKDAIEVAKSMPGSEEVFIVGGGEIYKESINLADRIYLTVIDEEIEGDTFFPEFDENKYELITNKKRTVKVLDFGVVYYFRVYEKK